MTPMTRWVLSLLFFFCAFASGQTVPITGVGYDAVTTTSARVHWTSGFYHDTATDTTLTTGFTTPSSESTGIVMEVGSAARMIGWEGQPNPGWTRPTGIMVGGKDFARINSVVDATHVNVTFGNAVFGMNPFSEYVYWSLSGLSISVSGTNSSDGVATATLYYPAPEWWQTGHYLRLGYSDIGETVAPIISRIDSTHVRFAVTCSPTCNGTHDYASGDTDAKLLEHGQTSHSAGETISFISADSLLCYGDPGGSAGVYTHSIRPLTTGARQEQGPTKHWVPWTGQTPGSRVHFAVMSTPDQIGLSSCSSPDAHAGISADSYIDFPATEQTTPTAPTGVSFSTALPGSYADSTTVGGGDPHCTTLQACLDYYRAQPGNHEIKIPANTTTVGPVNGWVLPPQTNGSLITTIRTSASDGSLPAPGACLAPLVPGLPSPCIDNPSYAPFLATLRANGGTLSGIFTLASHTKVDGIHLGPGIKLEANPAMSVNADGRPFVALNHLYGGGTFGHQFHSSDIIFDRVYFYQKNIQNGNYQGMSIEGGNSIAIVDCVMKGIANRQNDVAGIFLQNSDDQDGGYIIRNNRIEAAFDAVYFNGEGWNTGPGIMQQNWLHMNDSWNNNDRTFPKQIQVPVASASAGATTTITLSEPTEFGFHTSGWAGVSFTGFTGSWAGLNAREFNSIDGGLLDMVCAPITLICTAQTATPHGFVTGDYVWFGGAANWSPLSGNPVQCTYANGLQQVTVTDSTHLTWPTATPNGNPVIGRCMYPDAGIMGPLFIPSTDNSTWTIAFNSTGFATMTDSAVARYGQFVNTKNGSECKSCVAWDISGNIFENVIEHEQNAVGYALTNKTSAALTDFANWGAHTTISDMNFHDNWFRRIGLGMSLQGMHDYEQNTIINRVAITNNLFSYSDTFQCQPFQSCVRTMLMFTFANNILISHNTSLHPGIADQAMSPPPKFGNWTIKDNIFNSSGSGWGVSSAGTVPHNHSGSQVWQTTGTCVAGPCAVADAPFDEDLFDWRNNVHMGRAIDGGGSDDWNFARQYDAGYTAGTDAKYKDQYWPHMLGGIGLAGLTAVTNATNTQPIVLTVSTMGCVPDAGDRFMVSGIGGNISANGIHVVAGTTSTSLTLVSSLGSGAYTSGGHVIPISGKCNVASNFSLSGSSSYRAGVSHVNPENPYCGTSPLPACGGGSGAGMGEASDSTDMGVSIASLTAHIAGCSLSPGTLPAATVTESYSQTVTASGCPPDSYTITSGTLSGSGLSLNSSTGAITGTVAGSPATYSFTISYDTGSQAYSIAVSAAPAITNGALPHGTQGSAYSQAVTTSGGTGVVTCAVTAGSLSGSGISLSSCTLTGTGGTPGTYGFTVTPTDSNNVSGSGHIFSLVIDSLAPPTQPVTTLRGVTVRGQVSTR
jgi:hypothetical protein